MTKNAILLHGSGSTPEDYWFPYIQKRLERQGCAVWAPQLPEPKRPDLSVQLPFVMNKAELTPETTLIGHSAGCPLILSMLERIAEPVDQVILVAGFCSPLPGGGGRILQPSYDWQHIRQQARSFTFIHSDNDPWGCGPEQGQSLFSRLGGTLIIRHGEGHMGSSTFNQTYREFPLLSGLTATV